MAPGGTTLFGEVAASFRFSVSSLVAMVLAVGLVKEKCQMWREQLANDLYIARGKSKAVPFSRSLPAPVWDRIFWNETSQGIGGIHFWKIGPPDHFPLEILFPEHVLSYEIRWATCDLCYLDSQWENAVLVHSCKYCWQWIQQVSWCIHTLTVSQHAKTRAEDLPENMMVLGPRPKFQWGPTLQWYVFSHHFAVIIAGKILENMEWMNDIFMPRYKTSGPTLTYDAQ